MTNETLLLAQKTVRGHQFRLIYCESLFRIQLATDSGEQWETVHSEQLQEAALEFWTKQLTDRRPRWNRRSIDTRRIVDPRRH